MSKKKNKNSVTNVNTNNEEGRIMSMLNGMMNGCMNGGGNIMNNQFTNPNISTQAQHVLNQTVASGSGQVQYGYVPVDIPQQQQTQGTAFQQAPIDPNAQQNAQAQTQQQNAQQQGFTNPNNASQAQFVNPNAQSQQQTAQNQQNAQQQGFTNPKNQNEQVNDNKEDNIMNTENTNETSTSIIEDHPFISTALGIVGGILLGKFFFGSDDSSSSDVITIDTTATDDSI